MNIYMNIHINIYMNIHIDIHFFISGRRGVASNFSMKVCNMEGLILVFRKSVVNTYYFAHTPVSIQDESLP